MFAGDASSIIVASQALQGSSLYMYGEEKPKTTGDQKQPSKLPLPEIKWENHKVHDKKAIITLVGTEATYGSADGSTIVLSSSEGTVWCLIFVSSLLNIEFATLRKKIISSHIFVKALHRASLSLIIYCYGY